MELAVICYALSGVSCNRLCTDGVSCNRPCTEWSEL